MAKNKLAYSVLSISLSLLLVACSSSATVAPKEEKVQKENKSTETHKAHWSYEGDTGPAHWGDLDPANSACVNGKEQSPINIEISQAKADEKLEKLEIHYIPTEFSLVNNGHTVQANPKTTDNSIVVDGKEYKLAQFHFHTPSEHQFNGQNFDMELHLVHKDASGQLAVLGLMIKEGASNLSLEKAWAALPKKETTEDVKLKEPIDLMSILPKNQQSFRYNGSLTTPPCSEGVKWIVLEQPIEMSKEQIDTFRKIFPDNHRPVQSVK
ncbi:carbonic anhydrase [Ectobacillus panaciterrae]|uniref:carbonic anhydrase n=1 Tax=Ectobacillus panaciterrae TaxID=363872 RepID=UPI000400165D|nr:carbonic anhydrase family protein [Ectobacillus panaciterrae]